ncbi:MAG TPA: efflux RND transporter periplasmic adaptor subunit, partial [Armatimonadota bacterium]|nr:efflux RND transporter periplasmic adaptor subunit [Armatimonadota bacterium]
AADRGWKRAKFLYDRGGLPRAQLEAAEAAEAAAKAQVDSAESQAELVKAGAAPEDVRMAEELVRQAEAGLKSARAGEKRKQVSKQETDAARTQVFQAEAALQAARAGRAQASVQQEEVSAARAGLRQATAALQAAEAQLAATTLRSPVSGIVTRISAHPGESLMPGTPVATIVSLSGVYFEAAVSDRDRTLLRPGLSVSVRTASIAHSISGHIRDILPVAEADNRSFRVRVSLDAPGMGLTPGAFASGTAALSQNTRALLIPQTALQGKEDSWYVLRVLGNRIQRRAVKVGASRAGKMELCSGLQETDRIVLNPLETLRDGERVRVAPGNEKE